MAAMSWLIGFNIVNIRNNVVRTIWVSLNLVTEPILNPIRRILPSLGGVDLSPLVALLVILFVQQWVRAHS
ncbi:MAG: YggT family protein [Hyphomicrobiales bacterium]|nr:YggT family protein [Hyphomicrobiales bacterium]